MNIIKSSTYSLKSLFTLNSSLDLIRRFSSVSKLASVSSVNKTQVCWYSSKEAEKPVFKKATQEVDVPAQWGNLKVQIFGEVSETAKPIVALHGYLDNSNSFLPLSHYLTKKGYYVIAVDLPGHGFSSHVPPGVTYTTRLMLTALRRVVKYFHLKNFTLLSHSYGSLITLMYSAMYPKEIEATVLLDLILNRESDKRIHDFAHLLSQSTDEFIEFEDTKHLKGVAEDSIEKGLKLLTREIALKKLLKANRHLNEAAANLLLDRALVVHDNKLEFSRDKRIKVAVKGDHYIDFIVMSKRFHELITCPILLIYAWPPAYGEAGYIGTTEFFKNLKAHKKSPNDIQIVKYEGSHHFHMIDPKATSSIVLDFLTKKQETVNNA